jgi:hypothetical protein
MDFDQLVQLRLKAIVASTLFLQPIAQRLEKVLQTALLMPGRGFSNKHDIHVSDNSNK